MNMLERLVATLEEVDRGEITREEAMQRMLDAGADKTEMGFLFAIHFGDASVANPDRYQ